MVATASVDHGLQRDDSRWSRAFRCMSVSRDLQLSGARADVAPDTTAPSPIPPNPTPQRISTGRTLPPTTTTTNCFANRRPGTVRTTSAPPAATTSDLHVVAHH